MISKMKPLWVSFRVKAFLPQMYPFPEPDTSIPFDSMINMKHGSRISICQIHLYNF
jgi:hypothetical protein